MSGNIADAKEDVLRYAEITYEESKKPNDAYQAWDICYSRFQEKLSNDRSTADNDYLQLNLGMYLANWGMYRGSGFIRQYCYREYKGIVDVIWDYRKLFSDVLNDSNVTLYKGITSALQSEFKKFHMEDKNASQTLITKVLLGTLGCMPAYDTYFCEGVKYYGLCGTYPGKNCKAINDIILFYDKNRKDFDIIRRKMKNHENPKLIYTEAKFLDMGFFKVGERSLLFKSVGELLKKKTKKGHLRYQELLENLKKIPITNDKQMADAFCNEMSKIGKIKVNKHLFYYEESGKDIINNIAIRDLGDFLNSL